MGKIGKVLLVAAFAAFMTTTANAGYLVSIVDANTGLAQAELAPGASLSLDVVLSGIDDGSGQTADNIDMLVVFSQSGLILDSYSWSPPFLTGGQNDFSNPKNSALPMPVGQLLLSGSADVFGNVFETGTLANMNLTIPGDFPTLTSVEVTTQDMAFSDFAVNFVIPNGVADSPFTLRIIPEPATLALLGIGGIAVLRRRRRA